MTGLPLSVTNAASRDWPRLVGSLGYPGFEHLAERRVPSNPAAVVLAILKKSSVPARVTEALPWILLRYADLNWTWLVDNAKLANVQNRLGFLVSLTEELAEARNDRSVVEALKAARVELEAARLAKEDTLGRALTEAERQHFREHRSGNAAHWNVLTSLHADELRYGD